jgi:hypothetical protein
MTDYSDYPCGFDGLSFPNGLPTPNTRVKVKTVWSKDEWIVVPFMGKYGFEDQYDWFSIYGKPDVGIWFMPIVLEWKELTDEG